MVGTYSAEELGRKLAEAGDGVPVFVSDGDTFRQYEISLAEMSPDGAGMTLIFHSNLPVDAAPGDAVGQAMVNR